LPSPDIPFLTIKDISNNELLRLTGDDVLVGTDGQLGRRAALEGATLRELCTTSASAQES
jgi:hypothetical protein